MKRVFCLLILAFLFAVLTGQGAEKGSPKAESVNFGGGVPGHGGAGWTIHEGGGSFSFSIPLAYVPADPGMEAHYRILYVVFNRGLISFVYGF
jgi:hypothetical protein